MVSCRARPIGFSEGELAQVAGAANEFRFGPLMNADQR